jgi:hypothetical protein
MQGHLYLIGRHVLLQKRDNFPALNVLEDKKNSSKLICVYPCVCIVVGQYLSQETKYLVEVVDVIQHLYTCKTTIVIECL